MMSSDHAYSNLVSAVSLRIDELLAAVSPARAEDELRALMEGLAGHDLEAGEADLRRLCDKFHKKRCANLHQYLDRLMAPLAGGSDLEPEPDQVELPYIPDSPVALPPVSAARARGLVDDWHDRLAELSAKHIFQWATYYTDCVDGMFAETVDLMSVSSDSGLLLSRIRTELAAHATEVFGKGRDYQVLERGRGDYRLAIDKSLAGLQRFLELPVGPYSGYLQNIRSPREAVVARAVASAMLRGIIEGYGTLDFGEHTGWQLLPRFPRAWIYLSAFLTATDLSGVIDAIEHGDLRTGLCCSLLPVAQAIDAQLASATGAYYLAPALGQFEWDSRKLVIAIPLPRSATFARFAEVHCYLIQGFVRTERLEQAVHGGSRVVLVAPLDTALNEWVSQHALLASATVQTLPPPSGIEDRSPGSEWCQYETSTARRVLALLDRAVSPHAESKELARPVTYNFPRVFPLKQPALAQYWRVHRQSVRDLLRSFEARTGVRLWCSVRRSGKTTACQYDLSSGAGNCLVVTQTCQKTDDDPTGDLLYAMVADAIDSGGSLPPDFVSRVVADCAPGPITRDVKTILILDEYETLFDRMKLAVRRDPESRYRVVQPVLNQLVAFARRNLVVLIGQRADAHYIVMDQNQLSPYVEQDPMPLFQHGSNQQHSEFDLLLPKIVGGKQSIEPLFAAGVYAEAGGHPFLTANLLSHYYEWLIGNCIPQRESLFRSTYDDFVAGQLTHRGVRASGDYVFFRKVVREALEANSLDRTPWLFGVYSILREIGSTSAQLSSSVADIRAIVEQYDLEDRCGDDMDSLITAWVKSNFLVRTGDSVCPKIALLARIAASVVPPTTL